ncbi:MAG: hypothetical protein H6707_19020 [Deltaproteobacteria bacterium]|nr:hypothetical protein [Deltaproteobacteria bacterium]
MFCKTQQLALAALCLLLTAACGDSGRTTVSDGGKDAVSSDSVAADSSNITPDATHADLDNPPTDCTWCDADSVCIYAADGSGNKGYFCKAVSKSCRDKIAQDKQSACDDKACYDEICGMPYECRPGDEKPAQFSCLGI